MSFKYLIGYNHLSILLFCSIFLSISIIKKQLYVITYPISLLYCFCLFSIILIIPFFYYVQHLFISYPIVRTYALNFFRHHIFKSSIIPLSCRLSFFFNCLGHYLRFCFSFHYRLTRDHELFYYK